MRTSSTLKNTIVCLALIALIIQPSSSFGAVFDDDIVNFWNNSLGGTEYTSKEFEAVTNYECHNGSYYGTVDLWKLDVVLLGSVSQRVLSENATSEPILLGHCGSNEDVNSQRTTVKQVVGIISKHASNAFRKNRQRKNTAALLGGPFTGLSAGDSESNKGLWANYDFLRADDDQANSDTSMHALTLGGDVVLGNNLAIGLSGSYQIIDEEFLATNTDATSWTAAPYLAYMVSDYLTVDFVLGYTFINEEPDGGTSFDTNRYFFSANTTAFSIDSGDWDISANLGYIFTKDNIEGVNGGIENDISFAQIHTGMEFGYFINDSVEPYFNIEYEQDLVYEADPTIYDPNGTTLGTGIRVNMGSLMADIHASKLFARSNFEQYAVMGNFRFTF